MLRCRAEQCEVEVKGGGEGVFDDTMFMHACGDRQNHDLTRIHTFTFFPRSYLRRRRSEVRLSRAQPHVRAPHILSEAGVLLLSFLLQSSVPECVRSTCARRFKPLLAPPLPALPYERDRAIGAHTIVALRTDLG